MGHGHWGSTPIRRKVGMAAGGVWLPCDRVLHATGEVINLDGLFFLRDNLIAYDRTRP